MLSLELRRNDAALLRTATAPHVAASTRQCQLNSCTVQLLAQRISEESLTLPRVSASVRVSARASSSSLVESDSGSGPGATDLERAGSDSRQ